MRNVYNSNRYKSEYYDHLYNSEVKDYYDLMNSFSLVLKENI